MTLGEFLEKYCPPRTEVTVRAFEEGEVRVIFHGSVKAALYTPGLWNRKVYMANLITDANIITAYQYDHEVTYVANVEVE